MKLFLSFLIVFSVLLHGFDTLHEVLISGFSYHKDDAPYDMTYNAFNSGLGYRYRVQNELYETNFSILVFRDSYSNIMSTTSGGLDFYLFKNDEVNARVGLAMGLGVRKLLYGYDDFQYSVIPLLAPTLGFDLGRVGVNLTYTPKLEFDEIKINQVTYMYFNYTF